MKLPPQEIIARKRDGLALSRAEIQQFVDGVVSGGFQDYQATALLMAIVLRGMTTEETGWLTEAMIGQSDAIVPADRKLYALRDVTATVESIPLICASILSKKLAEGIDALVLDVKFGRGAFMPDEASGRELAESLVAISARMGQATTALLTRMDQPLGRMVGNSLEVIEAIDCLHGEGPADLMELTHALCGEMLLLGGLCSKREEALRKSRSAIKDGSALRAFRQLVEAQGGDPGVIEDYERLPLCERCSELGPEIKKPMYLSRLDARHIGEAACLLGAGRTRTDSAIDPAVGLELLKKIGDRIEPGEAFVRIHYKNVDSLEAAEARLQKAIHLSEKKPKVSSLIVDRIHHP